MCAVQAATPFSPNVRPMFGSDSRADDRRDLAHWFLVMRPDAMDVFRGIADPGKPPRAHGEKSEGSDAAVDEPKKEGSPAARDFRGRLQAMTDEVRGLPEVAPAEGHSAPSTGYMKPGLAGDPQTGHAAERSRAGIPIPPETAAVFAKLAEETGVVPEYIA